MVSKKLFCMNVIFAALIFSVTFSVVCLADMLAADQQNISVEAGPDNSSFLINRLKNNKTGEFIHTNEIKMKYIIRCEDENANAIKKYEGSISMPAGKNQVTVEILEIADEMKEQLGKYNSIYIWLDITESEGAFCISNEAISLTGKTGQDLASMPELFSKEIKDMASLIPKGLESATSSGSEGTVLAGIEETAAPAEEDQDDNSLPNSNDMDQDKLSGTGLAGVFGSIRVLLPLVLGMTVLVTAVITITVLAILKRRRNITK